MIEKMNLSIPEIDKLKQQLADTDYKIVKQSEATLVGVVPLPYTDTEMVSIHEEREALRERIRLLEQTGEASVD